MEMLSTLINHKVDLECWNQVTIGKNNHQLLYLFFADDLTLMAHINKNTITTIKQCLDLFCYLSGQPINKAKSKIIISKNCPKILASISQTF